MIFSKKGIPILRLEEWESLAGPKRRAHWQDDRSAKEVARAWLGVTAPSLPAEVATALDAHPAFGTVVDWSAEPEARLRFDDLRGEPRNTDLLVHARDQYGEFIIALEAKADEVFGETVAEALAAAVERKLGNPRSKGVERIEHLAAALLGPRRKGEPRLAEIRYQLLAAVAGAVAAAPKKGGQRVILLVQEFRTRRTTDANHAANARDLDIFVRRLSHGQVPRIRNGVIHGPLEIPGKPLFGSSPQLFIGKVSRIVGESKIAMPPS